MEVYFHLATPPPPLLVSCWYIPITEKCKHYTLAKVLYVLTYLKSFSKAAARRKRKQQQYFLGTH